MGLVTKTAAFGLFSALCLAAADTGESIAVENRPNSPESGRNSPLGGQLSPPEIFASDRLSVTGFYGITWDFRDREIPPGYELLRFEVEERKGSGDAGSAFALLYAGPDRATTLTGIPDDRYSYRVRAALTRGDSMGSPDTVLTAWSPPASLEVLHHSLPKAFGFAAVGAVVFLGTLSLIVVGHRKQMRNEK